MTFSVGLLGSLFGFTLLGTMLDVDGAADGASPEPSVMRDMIRTARDLRPPARERRDQASQKNNNNENRSAATCSNPARTAAALHPTWLPAWSGVGRTRMGEP